VRVFWPFVVIFHCLNKNSYLSATTAVKNEIGVQKVHRVQFFWDASFKVCPDVFNVTLYNLLAENGRTCYTCSCCGCNHLLGLRFFQEKEKGLDVNNWCCLPLNGLFVTLRVSAKMQFKIRKCFFNILRRTILQ